MNPSEIKKVLSEIGARPNKKLGQHFLIDGQVLKTIVETADIRSGERVLEIGPGLGVLTDALVEQGASVTALEQDRMFVEFLVGAHGVRPPTDRIDQPTEGARRAPLQIFHGDAARLDWDEIVGEAPWKFVSNLPYGITSLALRKALWGKNPPTSVVVLVQREVAERAIAKDGKTSLLSLMVALASSSAKIVRRVPAGAFYPPPKVESAILYIVPMNVAERKKKWGMEPELVMQLAKKGFAHPRKFLFSNLGIGRPQGSPLPENIRAEDLSPEDWASLARALTDV